MSSEQKKMCLQRGTSHCSAPLCSIPGRVTVQFPQLWCPATVHNCRKQHDQHLPLTAGTKKPPQPSSSRLCCGQSAAGAVTSTCPAAPRAGKCLATRAGSASGPWQQLCEAKGNAEMPGRLWELSNSLEFPEKCE